MRPRKNKRFKKKRSQTGWESSTSQRNMTTRCGQKFCLGSAPPHRSSSHCSLIIRKVLTRPCSVCVCVVQSSCRGYHSFHKTCTAAVLVLLSGLVQVKVQQISFYLFSCFPVMSSAAGCSFFMFSVFPLSCVWRLMKQTRVFLFYGFFLSWLCEFIVFWYLKEYFHVSVAVCSDLRTTLVFKLQIRVNQLQSFHEQTFGNMMASQSCKIQSWNFN